MKGKTEEIFTLYKIITLYFTNKLKGFVGGKNKNEKKNLWLIHKVYKNFFKITAT